MEELEITCKIELKDFFRFYVNRFHFCLVVLVLLLIPFIIFFPLFFEASIDEILGGVFKVYKNTLPYVILYIITLIVFIISVYKRNESCYYEYEYKFLEEGIFIKNKRGTSLYNYQEIKRINKTKKLFAISFNNRTAILLPTNDENSELIEKIYALLQEKCDNVKGKKK